VSPRATVAAVVDVLNRFDLAGVAPGQGGGLSADEYANEALPIASWILNRGRIERAELSAIWMTWFSDDLGHLPEATWSALLADLNATASVRP
jgi:hypothetical protein